MKKNIDIHESRRYFVQILRRGESETSFLIGQTRPVVVNLLVLMPCFVLHGIRKRHAQGQAQEMETFLSLCSCFRLRRGPFHGEMRAVMPAHDLASPVKTTLCNLLFHWVVIGHSCTVLSVRVGLHCFCRINFVPFVF